MRIDTGTMEDILIRGVTESVMMASRSLSSLISFLHRARRNETAELLQVAQGDLNNVIATMNNAYRNRGA